MPPISIASGTKLEKFILSIEISLSPNFCSSTVVFTLESLVQRKTIPALWPTIPPTFASP